MTRRESSTSAGDTLFVAPNPKIEPCRTLPCCAVGADGEWFQLHDALRASPMGALGVGGAFEGAVRLSAACVDCDGRRKVYGLPLAVPPEDRLVRGDSRKTECAPVPLPQKLLFGFCRPWSGALFKGCVHCLQSSVHKHPNVPCLPPPPCMLYDNDSSIHKGCQTGSL